MKKRLIIFFTFLIFLLVLAGCSKDNDYENSGYDSQENTEKSVKKISK